MTSEKVQKYWADGFRIELAPGSFADCEIFFRHMGHSPAIAGCDLFQPGTHKYLGFLYRENIDLKTKRAMNAFLMNNKKRWHRMHSDVDLEARRSL